jgi:hypothetical protein
VTNTAFARSLVSVEEYGQMIDRYKDRQLEGANRRWLNTIIRQRNLKRRYAS